MLLDGTQVVINLNRYYDYTFSITGIDYDHWYHEMLMGIHNWNNLPADIGNPQTKA